MKLNCQRAGQLKTTDEWSIMRTGTRFSEPKIGFNLMNDVRLEQSIWKYKYFGKYNITDVKSHRLKTLAHIFYVNKLFLSTYYVSVIILLSLFISVFIIQDVKWLLSKNAKLWTSLCTMVAINSLPLMPSKSGIFLLFLKLRCMVTCFDSYVLEMILFNFLRLGPKISTIYIFVLTLPPRLS